MAQVVAAMVEEEGGAAGDSAIAPASGAGEAGANSFHPSSSLHLDAAHQRIADDNKRIDAADKSAAKTLQVDNQLGHRLKDVQHSGNNEAEKRSRSLKNTVRKVIGVAPYFFETNHKHY